MDKRVIVLIAILVVVNAREWQIGNKTRVRRGFSGGYGGDGGSYGRGSDERDASVSREGIGGCSGEESTGYDGSREFASNRDGRSSNENRGGRSFAKSSASATASATSFNRNQKPALNL